MLKKKFLIKAETGKIENFDPNLEIALKTIQYHIAKQGKDFDFEIIVVFDGFVINEYFNDILNTFLHDIIDKNNYFNYIFKSNDFCNFVKDFILNIFKTTTINEELKKEMYGFEAVIHVNEKEGLSFKFSLPKTLLSKEEYEEFLYLGTDWVVSHLNNNQIFDCFLANMYVKLAQCDLLYNNEYKKIEKYKIGVG